MIKKVIKKICIAIAIIFCLPIVIIISIYMICPILDNIALSRFRSEVLADLELPDNTEIAEVISDCGNSGGTGNHTDLYVGILVKTDLPDEEFLSQYSDSAYSALEKEMETWAMGCIGVYFDKKEAEEGYFILEFIDQAPYSEFDLRGH